MVKPETRLNSHDEASSKAFKRKRKRPSRSPAERAAVAVYLKRKRKEAGLGVSTLASAIGVSHAAYQTYESARTAIPSHRLAAVASVLNIDHDVLFTEIAAVCVQAASEEHSDETPVHSKTEETPA
ncbi:helix-turn-helix domain-containing protein [Aureimonas psammosilenae]|uniref:helix-turn-helix domain-containing protein n=1 Tax=Aureimonas psammosilenae TaxID=2495496 RepID=UPI0012608D96